MYVAAAGGAAIVATTLSCLLAELSGVGRTHSGAARARRGRRRGAGSEEAARSRGAVAFGLVSRPRSTRPRVQYPQKLQMPPSSARAPCPGTRATRARTRGRAIPPSGAVGWTLVWTTAHHYERSVRGTTRVRGPSSLPLGCWRRRPAPRLHLMNQGIAPRRLGPRLDYCTRRLHKRARPTLRMPQKPSRTSARPRTSRRRRRPRPAATAPWGRRGAAFIRGRRPRRRLGV